MIICLPCGIRGIIINVIYKLTQSQAWKRRTYLAQLISICTFDIIFLSHHHLLTLLRDFSFSSIHMHSCAPPLIFRYPPAFFPAIPRFLVNLNRLISHFAAVSNSTYILFARYAQCPDLSFIPLFPLRLVPTLMSNSPPLV